MPGFFLGATAGRSSAGRLVKIPVQGCNFVLIGYFSLDL